MEASCPDCASPDTRNLCIRSGFIVRSKTYGLLQLADRIFRVFLEAAVAYPSMLRLMNILFILFHAESPVSKLGVRM